MLGGTVGGQPVGAGHQPADQASRRGRDAFGVRAALVEVAHEQVGAAGVALLTDFGQQAGDGDAGFFGAAAAQVVTERIDQRFAVARWPLQLLSGRGAGVALDGVL